MDDDGNGDTLLTALAPGPDYKLYLSPESVETEDDFERLKPSMARVGDVKTFKNFLVPVPESIEVERYNTVVVWCESICRASASASRPPPCAAESTGHAPRDYVALRAPPPEAAAPVPDPAGRAAGWPHLASDDNPWLAPARINITLTQRDAVDPA